jgi:cytochrome c-type biogenesis protein CcmH/NrfG
LYQAILAYESDVIQNPKNGNSWRMLGKCHAECDGKTLFSLPSR